MVSGHGCDLSSASDNQIRRRALRIRLKFREWKEFCAAASRPNPKKQPEAHVCAEWRSQVPLWSKSCWSFVWRSRPVQKVTYLAIHHRVTQKWVSDRQLHGNSCQWQTIDDPDLWKSDKATNVRLIQVKLQERIKKRHPGMVQAHFWGSCRCLSKSSQKNSKS